MSIPTWLASTARIVLVVAIPIVLLFSPLYALATSGFVQHEYSSGGFPTSDRFTDGERARLSDTIVRYLRGRESLEEMASMRTDGGEVALRDKEVEHLVDVKMVMDALFLAHGVALVLAAVCAWLLRFSPDPRSLSSCLRQGVWVTGGLVLLVLMTSFIDFDTFFTRFHQVFFSPDSWLFYETDTLIQLYPLPFWIDTVRKIGAFILVEMGAVYLISIVPGRSPRTGEKTP